MIVQAYSVYDKAAKAFLPPFFMRSRGEAIRSFSSAVEDTGHQFFKHKADYTLFWLGDWDDNSGVFQPVEPERIISALELDVSSS